jgi:cytochrome c6
VPWLTIVGIVADVRQRDIATRPRPAMYFAVTQDVGVGDTLRDWVVRSSGDPAALTSAVQGAVWSLDRTLPISRIQTMERVRSSYLGPQRFELWLVGLFAVLGLALAAVGLYGVMSYSDDLAADSRFEADVRAKSNNPGVPARARVILGQLLRRSAMLNTVNRLIKFLPAVAILFLLATPARAQEGASLFKAKCAPCHGPDGKGQTSMGKALKARDLGSADVQKETDAQMTEIIENGKGKMPGYKGKLTDAQIKELVKYIRTLKG